jgi:hypothetical protein
MILVQIVVFQIIGAGIVVWVLWGLLKNDLWRWALSEAEAIDPVAGVAGVTVISARQPSPGDEARLQACLRAKFPGAVVTRIVNKEIKGGLVIKAGVLLLDYSLLTRIKHLFSSADE